MEKLLILSLLGRLLLACTWISARPLPAGLYSVCGHNRDNMVRNSIRCFMGEKVLFREGSSQAATFK